MEELGPTPEQLENLDVTTSVVVIGKASSFREYRDPLTQPSDIICLSNQEVNGQAGIHVAYVWPRQSGQSYIIPGNETDTEDLEKKKSTWQVSKLCSTMLCFWDPDEESLLNAVHTRCYEILQAIAKQEKRGKLTPRALWKGIIHAKKALRDVQIVGKDEQERRGIPSHLSTNEEIRAAHPSFFKPEYAPLIDSAQEPTDENILRTNLVWVHVETGE